MRAGRCLSAKIRIGGTGSGTNRDGKCKADQLKQIWLLRLIIALAIDDEEKIQETFICYNGIEVRSKGFPATDIVRECLDHRDAETLTEVMKQSVVVKKEHPLRIGCISISLRTAFCFMRQHLESIQTADMCFVICLQRFPSW